MNKELFLKQLREALQGNVSPAVINENINYYENYILQELRKGKSEEEVFEMLGNPRILAQTIIDTSDTASDDTNKYEEAEPKEDFFGREGYNKVITGGKAKVILVATIVALILIIIGLIALIAGFLNLIAPVIVPLLLMTLVIRLFGRDR